MIRKSPASAVPRRARADGSGLGRGANIILPVAEELVVRMPLDSISTDNIDSSSPGE